MTRPLQIYLEDSEFERLEHWAKERGCTKSQAVRFALRALTSDPGEDPILSLSGMFDGPEDASVKHDYYLNESYVGQKKPRYRKSRPGK